MKAARNLLALLAVGAVTLIQPAHAAPDRGADFALAGLGKMEDDAPPPEERGMLEKLSCDIRHIRAALDGDETARAKVAASLRQRLTTRIDRLDVKQSAGFARRYSLMLNDIPGYLIAVNADVDCTHDNESALIDGVMDIEHGILVGITNISAVRSRSSDIFEYILSEGLSLNSYLNILKRRSMSKRSLNAFASESRIETLFQTEIQEIQREIDRITRMMN